MLHLPYIRAGIDTAAWLSKVGNMSLSTQTLLGFYFISGSLMGDFLVQEKPQDLLRANQAFNKCID